MIGGQIKFITRKKDLLHTDFGHIDQVCCRFVACKKEAEALSLSLHCILTLEDKCTFRNTLLKLQKTDNLKMLYHAEFQWFQ